MNSQEQKRIEQAMTNLQRIRKEKRLTQSELASKSGVSLPMIQKYERRFKNINHAYAITVIKLAKVLKCKVDDLMEVEE